MKQENNQLSAPINTSKEQFILKNINLRIRGQALDQVLNFNSSLLYAQGQTVKIILCFACNGKLRLLNNLQIGGEFCEYIKSMRQHNGFILYDRNAQLHIYSYNLKQAIVLKNSKFDRYCDLVLNKKDDFMISSTVNSKLKFWYKFHGWKCQTISSVSQIQKLCLNDQEDKLVALLQQGDICVYQKQLNNWEILQVISREKEKYVCFINNDILVVLAMKNYNYCNDCANGKIKTYFFDQFTNSFQFIFDKHIAGDYFDEIGEETRIDFIKEKNQLFVKMGNYVNIFEVNENRELIMQQKLRFLKKPLYESRMLPSQKGDFLAYNYQLKNCWDLDNIQIKKLRKYFD